MDTRAVFTRDDRREQERERRRRRLARRAEHKLRSAPKRSAER